VVGPDLLIVLALLFFGLVLPVWAVVDALSRPSVAFYAAGFNKTAWVVVLCVALMLGVGIFLGGWYLLFTRPKVHQRMLALRLVPASRLP
jgi:hypothetical protein